MKLDYNGYNIESVGTFPMVEIKMKGQGRVPKALDGMFTTTTEAKKAVDMYLKSLLKKGRPNAKTKSESKG